MISPRMGWPGYITILMGVAALFFIAASYALHWAHQNKQLENLEDGARSIFDDEEPEGVLTDQFPGRGLKRPDDTP